MADGGATPMLLGDALVAIGVDLKPLYEGFKEAEAATSAWEKHMADGSAGLLKFTAAANDAVDTLGKEANQAKAAGDATGEAAAKLDKMTDANTKAASASKSASDAMETEAEKTARLSAMIDRSIASMQERNRLSQTRLGEGVLGAQAGSRSASAAQSATMAGMTFGTAAEAAAVSEATKALKTEGEVIEAVGSKTHVSSQAIREMIVLMREAGRGDFTRMAGSASLLAQNLGLIEKAGPVVLTALGLIAGAVAVVGVAMIQGSREANEFQNQLLLTGNRAGLTASTYEGMADRIAAATRTTIGSNEQLIKSLASTNDFTAAQIESLVTAAQRYAKATGETATSVAADFAKMAEGPTKYAEAFQHAHVGIITPLELNHIRELEARGDKEQALAVLIEDVTDGITKNTVDNLGIMERAWTGFMNRLHDSWTGLKELISGTVPDQAKINALTVQINSINESLQRGHTFGPAREELEKQFKALVNQRSALQETVNTTNAKAAATAKDTEVTRRSTDAIKDANQQYGHLIDNQTRFVNDQAKLKQTLANAAGLTQGPNRDPIDASKLSIQALQEAVNAAHPADPLIKQLSDDLPKAIDKLKKQDLPAEFKADAKAAREAAAEAKKLANEAAALEKRRQQDITNLRDEAATLEAILPAYKDQSNSLQDVNRAKAVQAALTKDKLTADSAEGKTVAELAGHIFDLNKAIEDETKKRQELAALRQKTEDIEIETKLIGKFDEEAIYQKTLLEGLAKAKRDNIVVDDAYIKRLQAEAKAMAAATVALQKAQRIEQYKPTGFSVTGADLHGVDQKLGGKFKQQDDLKVLETEIAREKKVVEQAHKDGLISEKQYQDRLAAIDKDGAAKRREIHDQTAQMEIEGAQSIADSLASIAADSLGKQSTAYKVLFDISKAFAIAKAALALEQNVAEAMSKGFPQNIPLIAAAIAQGAIIVSDIRAISLSFQGGGYTGNDPVDKVVGAVHGQEFVANAQATRQYRPILEMMNAGRLPTMTANAHPANDQTRAPNITINDYAGVEHKIERGLSMNDIIITARKIVREEAPGVVAADLNRPNSRMSKSVQHNTTARRRRS